MLTRLLEKEVQQFILDHEQADERALVLSGQLPSGYNAKEITEQIVGRRKAKNKLPLWYETTGILFPPSLNLEQSSSELTARFKSLIVQKMAGNKQLNGADLTMGFGVDSYFLSENFGSWQAVEPDEYLANIAQHNHRLLGRKNISYHLSTAEKFTSEISSIDLIYIDPSRRTGSQRSIRLIDHEPNLVELQEALWLRTRFMMVKASPWLDIQEGLRQLRFAHHVWVVAVDNEVKELVFWCEQNFAGKVTISAVNLGSKKDLEESWSRAFSFTRAEEQQTAASFSGPLTFLYEPWAAILKSGAFRLAGARFNLNKLDTNTHLYTSNELQKDFPGRAFRVKEIVKLDRKASGLFHHQQANIISRNHPLTVGEISKRTGLREGGDEYLLAFKAGGKPMAVKATRLQ